MTRPVTLCQHDPKLSSVGADVGTVVGTNVGAAVERGPCVALGTSAEVSASELLCTEREREDDEEELTTRDGESATVFVLLT